MVTLTITVSGVTLALLYNKAFERQNQWLHETALNNASYIQAIAEHELETHTQEDAFKRTIGQIKNAHNNPSHTLATDYVLAGKHADQRVFLFYSPRSGDNFSSRRIPKISFTQPYQRALAGESGVVVGADVSGRQAIFSYAPIPALKLALVVKKDLQQFRLPFINAGLIAACSGLGFIFLAGLLFIRIGNPLISSAEINHTQLQTILNTIVDGVITCDKNGEITSFNGAAEYIFGYTEAEVLHKNISTLVPTDLEQKHQKLILGQNQRSMHGVTGINREVAGQRKDGDTFPIDIAISKNVLNGEVVFTSIVRDISERKHTEFELRRYKDHLEEQITQRTADLALANSKLLQLAREDSLTGIANRRVFDDSLDQELRRATRGNKSLSLLICDIDYFKNYNDSLGHLAGDACLRTVATLINKNFKRAGEVVARYGGEEFAVILPLIETNTAVEIAQRLLEQLSALKIEHPSSKVSNSLTMSIGVATSSHQVLRDVEKLIQAADSALYQAKASGRNRVALFDDINTRLKQKG